MPSVVVALQDILPTSILITSANLFSILPLCGSNLGTLPTKVESILTTAIFKSAILVMIFSKIIRLERFFVESSSGTKEPKSPKCAAPNKASQIACVTTSPSE